VKAAFSLFLVAVLAAPVFAAVGFQQLSVPDPDGKPLAVGLWYPSQGTPSAVAVGPFQQMVVPNGPLSGTALPLVLISHGASGSEGSHYDTAIALASEGFIVAALTHTGDNYQDQSNTANDKNLTDRPRQVCVVLTYMLKNWPQHDHLDPSRVGMFGFSLGGFTTLVVAGAVPDVSRMRQLCSKHPTAPECLFIKQRNGDQLNPPTVAPAWAHDRRVRAAVVAAPAVSYMFGPGSLNKVNIPVQLWRAAEDDQVPDAWNTALLREELPAPAEERVVAGAGHNVFLPPCSEGLAKQVPQICNDAPVFDRATFHAEFNREIVAFFKKTLAKALDAPEARRIGRDMQTASAPGRGEMTRPAFGFGLVVRSPNYVNPPVRSS
jgi:predicted dienelactone hydrolase